MKTTIAVVLLLCTALMVSAAAQAASGKELFVSKCATCPGADGSASPLPYLRGMAVPPGDFLSVRRSR